jgi:hypothetical protein
VRVRQGNTLRWAIVAVLLIVLALEAFGCKAKPVKWAELGPGSQTQRQQPQQPTIRIEAQPNRDVADLSPNDVVQIMRRIGFTDDLILALGTRLHDVLFQSGGAKVLDGKDVEALIRVNGTQIYIGSRTRGNFIYDLAYGQFVTPGGR